MELSKIMYEAINNSPQTPLSAQISAVEQTITVSSTAGFPPAPNIAVIGTDDTAEIIRYNGISGNALTGCERGFAGTVAKIWDKDTLIYRGFTKYDYDAFMTNIRELNSGKLDADGDGAENVETFTPAEARANIITGEKHKTIFGKIAKWFSDLKTVAFTGRYSDIDGAPTELKPTAHATTHRAGGADAITPADIGAQPKITANGILQGDGNGNITVAEPWIWSEY